VSQPPPNRPIHPDEFIDSEDFWHALDTLNQESGHSLRDLAVQVDPKDRVTHNTIAYWFKSSLPSPKNERAFRQILTLLGVTDTALQDAWVAAARRLRRRGSKSHREPYRGLDSYAFDDAPEFFGRAVLVDRVLIEIEKACDGNDRVLVLSGASGAGKSSLLKAGVMPALIDAGDRPVLFVNAGLDPTRALADEIAVRAGIAHGAVTAGLTSGPETAADMVSRAVTGRTRPTAWASGPESGDGREPTVVVVIDQLEQAMVPGGELAAFLPVLHGLVSGTVPTVVVLSVRGDFLDAAMQQLALQEVAARPPVFVSPMNDAELAAVIRQPAHKHGIKLEAGFVEQLLSDVSARAGRAGHEAGILPLLSHALRITWQRGGGKAMTLEAYHDVGGLDGAVRTTAAEVFELLSPEQQSTARRLFLTLVHLNPSGRDTRLQVPLDDLFAELDGCPAELGAILDQFVEKRLLTIDADTVEITHDAVLIAWPQLRKWLASGREGRLIAQRLADDARHWEQHERRPADLYRGTRLDSSREWRADNPGDIAGLSREFLDASLRRSRRDTRVLQSTIAVLSVLVLVVGVLAGLAYTANMTILQQRDDARSRTLASQAASLRGKDVTLSRQLALAAYRTSPTVEARSALIDATALRPAIRMFGGDDTKIMYAVALHPGGHIAAAAAENTVQFWDISSPGHPAARPALPDATCGKIYSLVFSPNGNLLAGSCGDGTVHLWDTHDPMAPVALPTLTGLGATVYSVVFSPDGSIMAAAIAEAPVDGVHAGSVRLWSVAGLEPRALGGSLRVDDTAPAKSVSIRTGNKTLAVGNDDGTVRLWDISRPDQPTDPVPAVGVTKGVGQLAFSPDGNTLAAGGADFTVHLWSTTDPHNPVPAGDPITGAATWVNAVAFSPDGATLAIASSDQRVGLRLVDVASRRVVATMPHPSPATSVRFSADGAWVITGANDGTARLWPVDSPTLDGMAYLVSAARFSPDGTRLAIGSADLRVFDVTDPGHPRQVGPAQANPDGFSGTLAYSPNGRLLAEGRGRSGTMQLWDVAGGGQPVPLGPPLPAHRQEIETVTFSPDSTLLGTGSRDGDVHVWDVTNPQHPVLLSTPGQFASYVNEVAFSPNGKLLAAGSVDKTVRLWDIRDPRKPVQLGQALTPGNHYVYSAIFSPDGTMLAISLADSTVRLYDITDPAKPELIGKPLTGPENYIYFLSFTSDGSTLAESATDGTVWIWDVRQPKTPKVLATLTVPTGALFPVGFQPHGRLLVAGGDEKKAWIWNTDPEAAARIVCDTSGTGITETEWAKYVPDRPYDPPCR
jgi:WD40 repeat protein